MKKPFWRVKVESGEEKEFDTLKEVRAWLRHVAEVFHEDMTAEVTKVIETTTQYWMTYSSELGGECGIDGNTQPIDDDY